MAKFPFQICEVCIKMCLPSCEVLFIFTRSVFATRPAILGPHKRSCRSTIPHSTYAMQQRLFDTPLSISLQPGFLHELDAKIFEKSQISLFTLTQYPGTDPGFWPGRQWSLDPKEGALSPKFAQNRDFPLKLPELPELPDFEEILGARGLDPLLIPPLTLPQAHSRVDRLDL